MTTRDRGVKRKQDDVLDQPTAESPQAVAPEDANKKARTVTITTAPSTALAAHRTTAEFFAAMLHTRAEQLKLPENKVFVAQRTDKVIDVFKGLLDHNFTSVPVLQKTGKKYWGFIDLADIVNFIVHSFQTTSTFRTAENFWKEFEASKDFREKTVDDVIRWPMTRENPFHPVRQGMSLLYTMEALAKTPHLRRLAVIDDNRTLVNLITQSQMIELLNKNMNLIGDKLNKPVSDIRRVFHSVFTIVETDEAYQAFKLMTDKNVSAVAVLDASGKLTGTLALKDLKGIGNDGSLFWRLFQTVHNYLDKLKKDSELARPRTIQVAHSKDTLGQVISRLIEHRIHRLWLVDDEKKPIGVISLKDVLLEILSE